MKSYAIILGGGSGRRMEADRNKVFLPLRGIPAIVRAIAETLGLKKNTTPAPTPDAKPFPDVPASAWYAEAVNELAARGIVNGYPDGTFKPEQTATRAEVAVMLYRALKSFAQNANDNK